MATWWSRIPVEIQLQIINLLEREDWKELRLTSRSMASFAEPQLFRTVHLTPNMRSFDRARNIAKKRHLARHVHAIVYHVGILEDVHSGFQTFRSDIIRLHHPSGSFDDVTRDILWKYNCFLEEMEGQREFEKRDESKELHYLCQRFDALESISTILDEDDPFNPPADFIGKRTGVQSACSADGPHFSSLFHAALDKQLVSINGGCVSWRCMSRILNEGLQKVDMSKMKRLALGLFNSEFLEMEPEEQDNALKALDKLLALSSTDERYTLDLDFDETPCDSSSNELRAISEVVFKHTWPALRRLALRGIVAKEDDIITFLERHSPSLMHLHLDDIDLEHEVLEQKEGEKLVFRGSIITLFRRISDVLRLQTATITGCFSNHFNESWYVDIEYGAENSLHRDIELWLVGKAPSPFPHDLVYPELYPKDDADTDISPARPGAEFQDGSFVWDMDYE